MGITIILISQEMGNLSRNIAVEAEIAQEADRFLVQDILRQDSDLFSTSILIGQ